MIVKVQLSQFDSEGRKRVLIYNKTRSIIIEEDASKEIISKMGDSPKKFFHVTPMPESFLQEKKLYFGNEVPWQNW